MREYEVFLYTNCQYNVKEIQKRIEESRAMEGIRPGDKVLLKPNFVQESDSRSEEWEHVITHPDVITAVLLSVCDKLQRQGEIVIADGPMAPARFDVLLSHFPVAMWEQICQKNRIRLSIIDLRTEEWWLADNKAILKKATLPGDPLGNTLCNLQGEQSEFYEKVAKHGFYGADYNSEETNRAHDGTNNWYSVSRTVMSADVFINIPKLKSHRKAGMTCCLKNLVGINTNKNYLPHHTNGTPKEGGDQYATDSHASSIEGKVALAAMCFVNRFPLFMPLMVPLKNLGILVFGKSCEKVRGGGWYGNDTLWRTIIDLNKVLLYSDAEGKIVGTNERKKKYIAIVDGIVAGEGNGPLEPNRKECGYLLVGVNPVAVDSVAAYLMGFDWEKIPSLYHAYKVKKYPISDFQYSDVICHLNGLTPYEIKKLPAELNQRFMPASGWVEHIERVDLSQLYGHSTSEI